MRHGISMAPIAGTKEDADFRVQRFALQHGVNRVLIRHRHGDHESAAKRLALDKTLAGHAHGKLVVDIGDFNEFPDISRFDNAVVVFPDSCTFRRTVSCSEASTTIDGAVVVVYVFLFQAN